MIKVVTLFAAAAVFSMPAFAQPEKLSDEALDQVTAGTGETTPVLKGNNGWGNGAEGINKGSFKGKTSPSKLAEGSVPGAGKVNQAPQSKFTGR